ncbi:MAG: DNA polymerase I [Clostridiales bacterium]|nr:DNA polymerase I [Clostridiales bacterium]
MAKGHLLLVDGHSLLHRAYYALPPLTSSSGQPTHALLGFFNMLLRFIKEREPDYVAVVLDRPGATFRDEVYEEYKAQRPPMPEDLKSQEALLEKSLTLLGIPWVGKEGFEADDVLGTLSKRAEKDGLQVTIVTGDRDAFQLVDEAIRVVYTKKGITEVEEVDLPTIRQRYGLEPPQLIDVKALMGDASDNIPGVKGIGEKTALKLIQSFGSLEDLYRHLDQVAGRTKELLLQGKEQALVSRELAQIRLDVPLEVDWEDLRLKLRRSEEAQAFFLGLDMRSLWRRYEEMVPAEKEEGPKEKEATSLDQLPQPLEVQKGEGFAGLAFPAEGLFGWAGVWTREGRPVPPRPGAWVRVKGAGEGHLLAGFGLKPLLRSAYFWEKDLSLPPLFDLELAGYLLEPGRTRYDAVYMASRLGKGLEKETYTLEDEAKVALALWEEAAEALKEAGLWDVWEKIDLPLLAVLARMEARGVAVDLEVLKRLERDFKGRLKELEQEIFELAGGPFTIASPQQLGKILFEKLGLPPQKKTKTGYSTDAETLEFLAPLHPLPQKVLEHRTLAKLLSTYVVGLMERRDPETGRVYTTFGQTIAATGRLSSVDPNLQNIPVREEVGRQLRKAFVAAPDHLLISADYSQIELRLLAHFSEDPKLLEAFRRGADIHRHTAAQVLGIPEAEVTPAQRSAAKAVNFGIIYGMSDYGLARTLGISREEAHRFIRAYFEEYPKVKGYLEKSVAEAREKGYVRTLFGRRRYLPDIRSRHYARRQAAERAAMNTPLQGTAADLIKMAMVQVEEALQREIPSAGLILQVHDELMVEAPRDQAKAVGKLLRDIMTSVAELKVPLQVEVSAGPSWADLEAMDLGA